MSVIFDDTMRALLPVLRAMRSLGVPYFVGGSLVSSLYGIARSTVDADIVADLKEEHAAPLVRALGDAYYADEGSIREAVRRRSSFNVIYLPLVYKVDVFVRKARGYDDAEWQRVRERPTPGGGPPATLTICSAEDIILNKLEWYRLGGEVSERQWTDLVTVMKVQREGIDYAYLDRWASDLGVEDLLQRARADAGLT